MKVATRLFFGAELSTKSRFLLGYLSFLVTASFLPVRPAVADGCFVFRWNKEIDINEPTQKAIILYDAGREDLLLQVKYEGPLEDFGWLIPVPTLPQVQQGSMLPFYELSRLTQQQFGGATLSATRGNAPESAGETVRVIEIKTVGAYEVAVLSAQDAGSLANWLRAHDYAVPEGKSAIVDEYIQKGWYFVAARIQLDREPGFRLVSNSSPEDSKASTTARTTLQKQLSRGELHPLLISFDSPRCIFPLKISSVAGKPSEVSIYVLAAEPLLERYIFGKAAQKYLRQKLEWERTKKQREEAGKRAMRNSRSLGLAWRMYSLTPKEKSGVATRDWTVHDLEALGEESQPNSELFSLSQDFYFPVFDFIQLLPVEAKQIEECSKVMPRLTNRNWYLTKEVYTFAPKEMRDLEFEKAAPMLAAALPNPEGKLAAEVLALCGESSIPVLVAACRSANAFERINAASSVLPSLRDPRLVEPLLALFRDEEAQVRFYAVMAASWNWDERFVAPLIALFHDPTPEISQRAAHWLSLHEPPSRAPVYLTMLADPDPNVEACAFRVLSAINHEAIPRPELLRLLSSQKLDVVSQALALLQGGPAPAWGGLPPVTFAGSRNASGPEIQLSSLEVAPLTTNRLTLARLMGLKVLGQNRDADALTLAIPLLRDTNELVRNRAYSILKSASGQDLPQADPDKWDQWWAANKANFVPNRQTH